MNPKTPVSDELMLGYPPRDPGIKLVNPQIISTVMASARWYFLPRAFSPLDRKGNSARKIA